MGPDVSDLNLPIYPRGYLIYSEPNTGESQERKIDRQKPAFGELDTTAPDFDSQSQR